MKLIYKEPSHIDVIDMTQVPRIGTNSEQPLGQRCTRRHVQKEEEKFDAAFSAVRLALDIQSLRQDCTLCILLNPDSDDDRYEIVGCGAAGQPTLDLSDQLGGCSIGCTCAISVFGFSVYALSSL